jgi:carbamate kinase
VTALDSESEADGQPTGRTTPTKLRRNVFAPGSMGQKVEAACPSTERSGRLAAIGAIDEVPEMLDENAGTLVRTNW